MTINKKRKATVGMTGKKRKRVTIMRVFFIIIILMISVGLVGGSFLFLM